MKSHLTSWTFNVKLSFLCGGFQSCRRAFKKNFTNFRNSNSLRQIMVLYAVVGFDQYLLRVFGFGRFFVCSFVVSCGTNAQPQCVISTRRRLFFAVKWYRETLNKDIIIESRWTFWYACPWIQIVEGFDFHLELIWYFLLSYKIMFNLINHDFLRNCQIRRTDEG